MLRSGRRSVWSRAGRGHNSPGPLRNLGACDVIRFRPLACFPSKQPWNPLPSFPFVERDSEPVSFEDIVWTLWWKRSSLWQLRSFSFFFFFFSFSQFRMFSDTSISNKLSVVNHFLTPATMCWESAIIEHAGKGGRWGWDRLLQRALNPVFHLEWLSEVTVGKILPGGCLRMKCAVTVGFTWTWPTELQGGQGPR